MMKINFWILLSLEMKAGFIFSDPETKAQSGQCKQAGSPPPKKFKLCQSAGKVMLVAFWDSHGIIPAHFMSKVEL